MSLLSIPNADSIHHCSPLPANTADSTKRPVLLATLVCITASLLQKSVESYSDKLAAKQIANGFLLLCNSILAFSTSFLYKTRLYEVLISRELQQKLQYKFLTYRKQYFGHQKI